MIARDVAAVVLSSVSLRRATPAVLSTMLVCVAPLPGATTQSVPTTREVTANITAFARLYGVLRYFYPSDAAAALDWDRYAVYGVRRVLEGRDRDALQRILRELVAPIGPGIDVSDRLPQHSTPASPPFVAWRYRGPAVGTVIRYSPYSAERTNRTPSSTTTRVMPRSGETPESAAAPVEFDLALGLRARVPVALTDDMARAAPATLAALSTELARVPSPTAGDSLEVRLADVVVAWSVFRHFYPYWNETGVDWDGRLQHHIDAVAKATTRRDHLRALQKMVADARDGHGFVADRTAPRPSWLPVRFRIVSGELVVTATSVPTQAPIGARVLAIDGVTTADRVADEIRRVSGSHQWQHWEAARLLGLCQPPATGVSLSLETEKSKTHSASLACSPAAPPPEARPASLSELAPGVWYVDLTRSTAKDITSKLDVLAHATAVIFDVRGYPTDSGSFVLRHLLAKPESDEWMHMLISSVRSGRCRVGGGSAGTSPHRPQR